MKCKFRGSFNHKWLTYLLLYPLVKIEKFIAGKDEPIFENIRVDKKMQVNNKT